MKLRELKPTEFLVIFFTVINTSFTITLFKVTIRSLVGGNYPLGAYIVGILIATAICGSLFSISMMIMKITRRIYK